MLQIEERLVELPGGGKARWEVASYPDGQVAVACLGFTPEEDALVLARNYRPSLGRWSLEVTGGLPLEGETSEVAARREFEEETGFAVVRMHPGPLLHSLPGLGEFPIACFLAETSYRGRQRLDENERIEVVEVPATQEAIRAVRKEIDEPVTLVMLDYYLRWSPSTVEV